MTVYTKESIKEITEQIDMNQPYLPKEVFEGSKFGNVRLETKLAYAAIVTTLLKKPVYGKDGKAFIKSDSPEVIRTLQVLANKNVDQDKMQGYYQELVDANLIEINNKDIFVKVTK